MPRRNPALPAALARLDLESAARAHVATTAQARAAGVSADAIRALVAAGRWMHLHRGVHLTRPGAPSLLSRMWGAHLALGPTSVVGGTTAAAYWGQLEGLTGPVEMLLPDGCSRAARGVRVRRVPHPSSLAHPVRQPPVLSVDCTVLEMVRAAPTDGDAVEVLLRSIRSRLTTADRLRGAADQRPRLRRRALLAEVCADAEAGLVSPLERRYARAVEHGHGLPRGDRQRRVVSTGVRTGLPGGRSGMIHAGCGHKSPPNLHGSGEGPWVGGGARAEGAGGTRLPIMWQKHCHAQPTAQQGGSTDGQCACGDPVPRW